MNKFMLKVAAIAASICVLALGALFVITRNNNAEHIGANGTICDKETCKIAIYDGAPGIGKLSFYYLADASEMGKEDIDEYFYLVNYNKEEMKYFGYDVSEGSHEDKIFGYTSKYAMGYYYY